MLFVKIEYKDNYFVLTKCQGIKWFLLPFPSTIENCTDNVKQILLSQSLFPYFVNYKEVLFPKKILNKNTHIFCQLIFSEKKISRVCLVLNYIYRCCSKYSTIYIYMIRILYTKFNIVISIDALCD